MDPVNTSTAGTIVANLEAEAVAALSTVAKKGADSLAKFAKVTDPAGVAQLEASAVSILQGAAVLVGPLATAGFVALVGLFAKKTTPTATK